jgi:hypothetical protein
MKTEDFTPERVEQMKTNGEIVTMEALEYLSHSFDAASKALAAIKAVQEENPKMVPVVILDQEDESLYVIWGEKV